MAKRENMKTLGQNIGYTVEGGFLILQIPVTKAAIAGAPVSKGGKMRLVGSTGGWLSFSDPALAGLRANVMVGANLDTDTAK
jgi:hypothetical protein